MGFWNKPRQPPADGLTAEHVRWAYRLLLDREPESDAVIGPKLAGSADTRQLRHHLMTSAEFREKNPDYAHTNDSVVVIKELRDGGPRLFVDLSDHVIGLGIVRGGYEQDEVEFVRSVVKPGDVAIDVGAHIGYFSMHLADAAGAEGHVYAFEPFPSNAALLARSIAENRFESRVTLTRAAAGPSSGTAQLSFARETLNTGGAHLVQDGAIAAGNETMPVEVRALDDMALRRPVRFVKLDAEGAEPGVLEGARRLLLADRPVILTELHPAQLSRVSGVTPGGFIELAKALGYEAFTLESGRPGPPLVHSGDAVTSVVLIARSHTHAQASGR